MRRRFKSALLIICVMLLASFALGGFYIKYSNNKKGSYVKVSGPLSVNFASGNHVVITGSKTVDISIINDSAEDAYYYIEFKNLKNVQDVKYTITNSKDESISNDLNPYNSIVSSYILIEAGASEDYKISFKSASKEEYSLDIDVNMENLGSNTFADVILKNNEVKESPLTKVGEQIATEDEGLIADTDEIGKTYYFRGNVQNNYVSLNDNIFRIVRINGDGSVKLVYDGRPDQLNKYYDSIDNYAFSSSYFYTYLDSWILSLIGDYKNILATHKYCNDITIENYAFVSYNRLKTDNIPSFYCLSEKVSAKVALLTADEVIYAGATTAFSNTSFYLYNSSIDTSTYLMTSAMLMNDVYSPFILTSDGKLDISAGNNILGVRPVITINKTAIVESGDGSVNKPYILTTNA